MEELELEMKQMIIDVLKLDDVAADDIDTHAPLFGTGLGLDSLDALEIAMAMSKRYGIQPSTDEGQNRETFKNVANLARYVAAHRTAPAAPSSPGGAA